MDWYFEKKIYFGLFLIFIGIFGLLFYKERWVKAKKSVFCDAQFENRFFETNSSKKYYIALLFLAFSFLFLAFVDVLKGQEITKSVGNTKNIVFALDVSNSMNAEDVDVSRLEQSKKIILHTLPKLRNDKVSVVLFAGDAISIMPLTKDFSAVENYISTITSGIMQRQGTDFEPMMKVASKNLENVAKDARNLIILSDGEDNESNINNSISIAKTQGINVLTVGVGSDEGSAIPDYNPGQVMDYKRDISGNVVISKRMSHDLVKIANYCDGEYVDGNHLIEASQQIEDYIKNLKSGQDDCIDMQNQKRYYQYFLLPCFLLFFIIYLTNPKKDLNL